MNLYKLHSQDSAVFSLPISFSYKLKRQTGLHNLLVLAKLHSIMCYLTRNILSMMNEKTTTH